MSDFSEFTPVPDGKIAAVVTYLEMHTRPDIQVPEPPGDAEFVRVEKPTLDEYRTLYRKIGEDWLWFSRVVMEDDALAKILSDPNVELHVLAAGGSREGILELDYREPETCEIAFFGISEKLIGTGAAHWLMCQALYLAWRPGVKRVWIHTCTLDHPNALPFYLRAGFTPYAREIEIFDDPRLSGTLPSSAAGHIPLINPTP